MVAVTLLITKQLDAAGLGYGVNSTGDGDNVGSSNVCDDGTGHCTLRAAIQAANSHTGSDTIGFNFPPGAPGCDANGNCTINLPRALPDITEGVTISGPGPDKVIVRRNSGGNYTILRILTSGTVTLSGISISDGSVPAAFGGGIVIDTFDQLSVTVNITNCIIRDNYALRGGGIFSSTDATLNVSNSTFTNNSAALYGGAIEKQNTATFANCNFTTNSAGQYGGAIYTYGGELRLTNSVMTNNSSGEEGGAIYNGAVTIITNSVLSSNRVNGDSASVGGALSNHRQGPMLSATLTITGSTFAGNSALDGSSPAGSGAVGGAIWNDGTVTISNSTFSSNTAQGGDSNSDHGGVAEGGAIFDQGSLAIASSTFSGNSAVGGRTGSSSSLAGDAYGGAIFSSGTAFAVTNSTIFGNSATYRGGEVGFPGSAHGGGISSNNAQSTIKSSIIASNSARTSSADVAGSFASQGFNLIGKVDGSTGFTQPTDQTGTNASPLDPKVDPNGLNDNGGPTQTIALLFGSPAIDKGSSAGLTGNLTTDQRGAGFPRTFDDSKVADADGGDGTDIGAFEVQVAAPTPTASPSKLGNISTRLRVESGENILIGGFIITGSDDKKFIARAIGPSLGFDGALADPYLQLYNSEGGLVAENDNWEESPNRQAILDSTIPPSHPLEAAIVESLAPAAYTALVTGVNGGSGVGLVEVYDLNGNADSQLANISTRGFVQTGANVMIGGFIVVGSDAQKLIVRALGPSLPVAGKLENPTLEVFDGNGTSLAFNDNWRETEQAAIEATGIPPSSDLESAIVGTVAPGAYTAIVRGANETTGIALVEVYALR